MTLTKDDIIDSIYKATDLQRSQTAEAVESLFETVKGALEKGENVLISGLGRLCVTEKKERKGRNPATGVDLRLKPRRVVTFKCSLVLREKINGNV